MIMMQYCVISYHHSAIPVSMLPPLAAREFNQVPFSQNILNLMVPLTRRPVQQEIPIAERKLPGEDAVLIDEKSDLRERNRLAAQKWRKKKDQHLAELEELNDQLRKQALELVTQTQLLRAENKVLESELLFFQQFMSKIMSGTK